MNDQTGNEKAATPSAPPFTIQRIYLKDASFETPMGIKSFQPLVNPRIQQEIQTRSAKINENNYEVILTTTISLKTGETGKEETVFIVEVQQAGIFQINIAEEAALKHQISVICPSILFPYMRETIDAFVTKGNFPPVLLPPVNFQAIYQKKLELEAAEKNKTAH